MHEVDNNGISHDTDGCRIWYTPEQNQWILTFGHPKETNIPCSTESGAIAEARGRSLVWRWIQPEGEAGKWRLL